MEGGRRSVFFDRVLIYFIILYCKEQQVTLIYLLIYLINLFIFCQLDIYRRPIHIDLLKQ